MNNLIGTRYPIRALSNLMASISPDAKLHVDAVQALGKIENLNVTEMGASTMSLSAHKFHGPKVSYHAINEFNMKLIYYCTRMSAVTTIL